MLVAFHSVFDHTGINFFDLTSPSTFDKYCNISSWIQIRGASQLDIDDHCLLTLEGEELVYFDTDKRRANAAQTVYQEGKTPEKLYGMSKSEKAVRISLGEINSLKSDHHQTW